MRALSQGLWQGSGAPGRWWGERTGLMQVVFMLVLMLGPHSFVARSGPQHARAGPHTQCEEAHRIRQVREGAPVSKIGAGSVASKPQSMARLAWALAFFGCRFWDAHYSRTFQ